MAAIAGGAAGGVAVLAAVAAILFIRRRRRLRGKTAPLQEEEAAPDPCTTCTIANISTHQKPGVGLLPTPRALASPAASPAASSAVEAAGRAAPASAYPSLYESAPPSAPPIPSPLPAVACAPAHTVGNMWVTEPSHQPTQHALQGWREHK